MNNRPLSEKRLKDIQQAKDELLQAASLLDVILQNNNVTLRQTAKKLNMEPTTLNRLLNTHFAGYIKQRIPATPEIFFQLYQSIERPSERILRAVFGLSDTPFPLEYDETLFYEEYLHTIADRNREILLYYYGNENNEQHKLKECSEKFDCTPERIRQILAKTIRQLRHPTRLVFLFCKPEDMQQYEYIQKIKADINRQYSEIQDISTQYSAVIQTNRRLQEILDECHELVQYDKEYDETKTWDNIPLEELNMSRRLYNCLRYPRYSPHAKVYYTLQDLADTESMQDFARIQNFGKGCYNELQDVLTKRGIYIPEYPPKES